MKKGILILFAVFFLIDFSFGQDIHFSQFYAAPFNLNPALTGAFNGDYRITANHRTQWRAVTVPYTTTAAFFDMRNIGIQNLHGGVSIYHDKAGDSRFSTFQFNVSGAYSQWLDKEATKQLIVGFQTGVTQRSINFANLSFDNQYNGIRYDANLGTGETLARQGYMFFNLNTGIAYGQQINENLGFSAGVGVFNINKPEQSFFSNERIGLERRMTIFGKAEYQVNEEFAVIPSFLMMFQGPHREYLAGGAVKYVLEAMPGRYRALYAGSWFRMRDAGFIMVGMDYNTLNVGISYDINYSSLVPASNYRGGFEVSVVYIIHKLQPQRMKYKICPGFI
jgi:type IX secretion system PorP/SprF family membrane protein